MPESETNHGLKVSDRLKAIDPNGYLKNPRIINLLFL